MNDFTKTAIEFLIKTIIKAALAAGVAFVLMGVLALFGEHIGWWSAYAISLIAVFGGLLIIDDNDWLD